MRKYIVMAFFAGVSLLGTVVAADIIDTAGTKLYFPERIANEKREISGKEESYLRSYLGTLSYSPLNVATPIALSQNTDLASSTATELGARTSSSAYAYKIFGVFKDSAGLEVYYQDSASAPLAISPAGDLYFSSFAGDLDFEFLDYNKGVYPITVNAYTKKEVPSVTMEDQILPGKERYYLGTLSYSSLAGEGQKIVMTFDDAKKYTTPTTFASAEKGNYIYYLQGGYKNLLGKIEEYKEGATPPLAISPAGDLYFTLDGGKIGDEKFTTNKGNYAFYVSAKNSENIEVLGSRTDFLLEITKSSEEYTPRLLTSIKGSGSVYTVYLQDNVNEFTLRPKFFATSLQKRTESNSSIPYAQILVPSFSGMIADFSAQFSNEEGKTPEGVSYTINYRIKGALSSQEVKNALATPIPTPTPTPALVSESPTPSPTPIPPLVDGCTTESDELFFYIEETTGKISFVPDTLLSSSCKTIKNAKTKFLLSEISLEGQKNITHAQNPVLASRMTFADASPSFEAPESFSEVYRVEIALSVAAPTAVPVSGGGGGGGGSSGGGWNYVAPPTSNPCAQISYKRYPENRGKGVSSDLFTDALSSHRAYKALIDLGEQKVVNGDQATGKARLNDNISRAEFVKIVTVGRQDTLGADTCLKTSLFPDVGASDWFSRFVWNMESRKFVNGYDDGYYRPAKNINLAETYKIIALAFAYITPEEAKKAVNTSGVEWFVPYLKSLEEAQVIPPWFANYGMATVISRGDMFALLSNVLKDKDNL